MLVASSSAQRYEALNSSNFKEQVGPAGAFPQGFGDRQNSWAWSMAWFKGSLYVGTNRAYHCMEQASLNLAFPDSFPYPPADADILCPGAPDRTQLPLQAEIWRWTPSTRQWTRVYQSPADVPIPGAPGRLTSRDVGYRAMHVFTEPDGTQALYASGLSAKWVYGSIPSARIIRSADGVNFAPLPQDGGTVLGNLGNAGFRGMATYKNRLYIIGGNINGFGQVLEAADPARGNNAFRVISPPGMNVFEIEPYNGFLYLGTNNELGFEVYKTSATPDGGPYTFTKVIPNGGYRTLSPNRDVISMKEFDGRLFVGGNGVRSWFGAELYRINPDDTWDLVAGLARDTPQGRKEPISGLGPGFGWPFNAHMWRQAVYDGRLYVGTFDLSTVLKEIPIIGSLLSVLMGGDLWRTEDGVHFSSVTARGFEDRFNFGVRTLEPTPYGLFLGTANYYYGLKVLLGTPYGFNSRGPVPLFAPSRLDAETVRGENLLTWEGASGASAYSVYRSTATPQDMTAAGAPDPVWVPGPFVQIGTTQKTVYTDAGISEGLRYIYYVIAKASGKESLRSNYAETPLVKGTTLSSVADLIRLLGARSKFKSALQMQYVTQAFQYARQQAMIGNPVPMQQLWTAVKANLHQGAQILEPLSAQDLERILAKILKRLNLYNNQQLTAADM